MGSLRVWFTRFYVRAVMPAMSAKPPAIYPHVCGQTSRHLSTRMREHLVSDRTSHILKHLHNSPQCRTLCSDECSCGIFGHASTTVQLKIKEAIHMQWGQPTLNHQLYHVNLKLSL